MISAACEELGERGLVCAGGTDITRIPLSEHIKVVGEMRFADVFPACRAVVHHGGAGTTAAGLRAGIPTLVLWTAADQVAWGRQVKRLKVGTARRLSGVNAETLVKDLRTILAPDFLARAQKIATRMGKPTENVMITADLLEDFGRSKGAGG
nr:glycosyl transferase family protein [Mycolicibacterium malmesburyense]